VAGTDGGGGRSISVVNNFVVSAPPDRRTQGQIACAVWRAIQGALIRIGG
jgi:hypothetical protein